MKERMAEMDARRLKNKPFPAENWLGKKQIIKTIMIYLSPDDILAFNMTSPDVGEQLDSILAGQLNYLEVIIAV